MFLEYWYMYHEHILIPLTGMSTVYFNKCCTTMSKLNIFFFVNYRHIVDQSNQLPLTRQIVNASTSLQEHNGIIPAHNIAEL